MIKAIILALVVAVAFTAPSEDRMDKVPGYPDSFLQKSSVYSGYLPLERGVR